MAFYRPDRLMQEYLVVQLRRLAADGRPDLLDHLAVTWVRYDGAEVAPGLGRGATSAPS